MIDTLILTCQQHDVAVTLPLTCLYQEAGKSCPLGCPVPNAQRVPRAGDQLSSASIHAAMSASRSDEGITKPLTAFSRCTEAQAGL